jgi:hypothetical protein
MVHAHYIVFHPDYVRQRVRVNATALVGGILDTAWAGEIYVDAIGNGNEDPFVFNDPWLYSYCHASQLRRNDRPDSFVKVGSVIIFVSGQQADNDILAIDTVFIVGGVQKWEQKPSIQLPSKYSAHLDDDGSPLWNRHFRFPFEGSHSSVSHTYEAKQWGDHKEPFSFLPLSQDGDKTSVQFSNLDKDLCAKIKVNVSGKYPVLLTGSEVAQVLTEIESNTKTKVLKDINMYNPAVPVKPKSKSKHAC